MTKAISTDSPRNDQESTETPASNQPFTLALSPDKMKVTISCSTPTEYKDLTSELVAQLTQLGVSEANILKYAEVLKKVAKSESPLEDFVIIQGTHPGTPKDGEMVWTRDFFSAGFVTDPKTGAVDYRERSAETTVAPGDFLGEVAPPQPGQDGIDVLGNAVRAAKCRELRIQAGSNVRQEDVRYYSEIAGQVRFNGKKLVVDDVVTISGSVGLKTGNINHPGALVVMQNIESESRVEALGSIDVNGYIEDSDIVCGGDCIVNGGIIGGEGRTIRCNGGLQARFIKNAVIEAEDDVIILSTIENSIIKTRGIVRVVSGRIVGGEIIALGGIDVGSIGSQSGVATKLIAGVDYKFTTEMTALKTESDGLQKRVATLEEKLLPLKRRPADLNHKMRETLTALMHQADEMHSRVDEIEEDIKVATGDSKSRAKEQIIVRNQIFPGTELTVGLLTKQVHESVQGLMRVAISEGDIRILQKSS